MTKFYAVKIGKIPGIYTTWEECKKQVIGFPKAIYKSFLTRKEAETFIGCSNKISNEKKDDESKYTIVYFDGSFKKGSKYSDESAGGSCYIPSLKIVYYQKISSTKKRTNNTGELTGLKLALSLTQGPIEIKGDSLWAINCVNKNFKAVENLDLLQEIWNLTKNHDIKWTHVYGHVGIEGNEICDKYAKLSLSCPDTEIHSENI